MKEETTQVPSSPSSLIEAPEIYLTCEPSIARVGDSVMVSIRTNGHLETDTDLTLELVSEEATHKQILQIPFEGSEARFVLPDDFPIGEYSIQLRRGEWILDSIPFEIAEIDYVRQAHAFTEGLKLRVDAENALNEGNFEAAIALTRRVEELYNVASSTHIAARAWKDLGSALLEASQAKSAQEAFGRAYILYGSINDAEGQAGTLLLAAETSSQLSEVEEALEILDRARTLADSCNADLIALRSRAALWRLSIGGDEALRRRYGRELIIASCSLKSNTTRSEALTLYRESVSGALLNNLWSFHQWHVPTPKMRFECFVSPRLLVPHHGSSIAFKGWLEDKATPWDSFLFVFTSTLLTQIIVSLSQFILQMNIADVEFKVTTKRDLEKESFSLSFVPGPDQQSIRETINRYVSSDADFHYYEQLARTVGASLIARTNRPNFIEMEMPLTLGR